MSMTVGLKPCLRAVFAMSTASLSQLPDSLANRMVSGSAARDADTGCGAAAAASSPLRKPASQARCVTLADPTTRLRISISSSAKGAVFGIGEEGIGSTSAGGPASTNRILFLWGNHSRQNKKLILYTAGKARVLSIYTAKRRTSDDFADRPLRGPWAREGRMSDTSDLDGGIGDDRRQCLLLQPGKIDPRHPCRPIGMASRIDARHKVLIPQKHDDRHETGSERNIDQ